MGDSMDILKTFWFVIKYILLANVVALIIRTTGSSTSHGELVNVALAVFALLEIYKLKNQRDED